MVKLHIIVLLLVVVSLFAACDCWPGSYITIINNTPYDFVRKKQSSFQMDDWDFPERIESQTSKKVYYEYCGYIFNDWTKDVGYVTYEMSGTEYSFEINAVHTKNGDIYALRCNWPGIIVHFYGFVIDWNSKIDHLTWVPNGNVDFDLSGDANGNFRSKALENFLATPKKPKKWLEKCKGEA